ncbi:uncharacterized protein ACN2A1_007876 [Glossina fuscipes fuscipes]
MSLNLRNQCRTCLKTDIKLQKLTAMIDGKAATTYKDALKTLANFLFKAEYEDEMPQRICDGCCRKLRSAQNFIIQAEEANGKLIQILKDIQQMPSLKQLDCLNENPIELSSTVEQCLQIKMEVENFESAAKDLEQIDNLIDNIAIKNEQQFDGENQLLKSVDKDAEANYQSSAESIAQNESKDDTESSVDEFEDEYKPENAKSDNKTKRNKQRKLKKMSKYKLDEDDLLPVRCEECGKVLENSLILARHKRSTHLPDELKIPCPNCGRRFSRRCNMYAHMRTFHGQESVDVLLKNSNTIQYRYKCDKCSCKYTNKYKLQAHVKSKHSSKTDENNEMKSNSGPVANEEGHQKSKKIYNYDKKFLCTICGLPCQSQSALTIHVRRHTGEKPFKCDLCDRAYARLYDVQIHRRSHTGEKPYKCTVCEKAFKRSNKLKIHMRTHTNERPYKCPHCERSFKQSKDLNIHIRTHTGERPYKCNVCQNTFTQSNSLKAHRTKYGHIEANTEENIPRAYNTILTT